MKCPVCMGDGSLPYVLNDETGAYDECNCWKCNGTGEVEDLTNGDIFNFFKKNYPDIPVSDYRPLVYDWIKDKPGILIWPGNGDAFVYFPDLVDVTERKLSEGGTSQEVLNVDKRLEAVKKMKEIKDYLYESSLIRARFGNVEALKSLTPGAKACISLIDVLIDLLKEEEGNDGEGLRQGRKTDAAVTFDQSKIEKR